MSIVIQRTHTPTQTKRSKDPIFWDFAVLVIPTTVTNAPPSPRSPDTATAWNPPMTRLQQPDPTRPKYLIRTRGLSPDSTLCLLNYHCNNNNHRSAGDPRRSSCRLWRPRYRRNFPSSDWRKTSIQRRRFGEE